MRAGPAPRALRGEHVVLLAQHQGRRADDAGIFGPGDHDDGDRHVDDARPQHGDDGKRQDDGRKAEEDVGDAHQQQVDPAAEIAGGEADRRADQRRDAATEMHGDRSARCARRRPGGTRGRGRNCRCRASAQADGPEKRLRMSICSTPWVASSGREDGADDDREREDGADHERGIAQRCRWSRMLPHPSRTRGSTAA